MNEHIKLSGLVTNYITRKKRNTKLVKDKNFKSKDELNIFLKNNPLILKKFNYKFVDHINIFLNRIQTLNPNIDLKLFYNNLNTLSIKEKNNFNKWIFITTTYKGTYDTRRNKIAVLKEDDFFSIYHELLHCASTKKQKNIINTGFCEIKNKYQFGTALNEGYTALLQERYFKEMYNNCNYSFLKFIASQLETIIGKDKMELLYFNGDLNGLIMELNKYEINERSTITFINQLDFLHHEMENEKSYSRCQEILYNVTNFLVYCYKQKYKEGENLKYSLNKFISFFKLPFISNNIKYRFIREDDFILGSGKIEKQYDDTNDFHKYLK